MPNLRDIKRKIEAVKKIGQITKAMNMVAAAKLRGAQERVEQFRPYATKFQEVITDLASSGAVNPAQFELMQVREVKKVEIILVTADRGLCGAFNANLINACEKLIREQKAKGREISLICVGKKGSQYFSKTGLVRQAYEDIMGRVEMFNARAVARDAMQAFIDKAVDETYIIYGYFVNVVRQIPKTERLLPIAVEKEEAVETEAPKISGSYIYEPEPEELFAQILPLYINTRVMAAMLETAVSEQAARMTAMDNANRACGDMVQSLTLLFNKTRQAAITKELMDIVGGAEALKG
ncbi:ATP synthase F1, gamma subunit [Thermodesulfatator indicus DSM 15286]|uniref:ATP synthase gamma chain n=1 Tax=Thermodesulfatator indicus (strain DSM 15286 / JCM 11887 / CIR29812) TaxID=667014 RepID=F8A966_THEID|nr:ATP synthase F1 subunit gamma [Thermodesulfatator indicus]AEH45200.1 ATP synthase F1, gamma subunit [Thermodesulfatator indicus DSM 15286]